MTTYLQRISEMGKSEVHELENRLSIVLEHLLKIRHVEGLIGTDNLRGWRKSIRGQLIKLTDLIDENPGLKPRVTDSLMDEIHRTVVAELKKKYPGILLPRSREFSLEEIVGAETMAMLGRQ